MRPSEKDIPLEALRGIAAVVVIFWHCLLAFWPARSGIFPNHNLENAWNGALWFGIFNGNAAVTFFFVLSGFVLTRKYYRSRDDGVLVVGAIKRWPRLAGPVLLSVIASWALFNCEAYLYTDAAAVTQSPWLADFAYAFGGKPFEPSFQDALYEGLAGVFINGASTYNSSLWTMRYELIGSLMAFAFAALAVHTERLPTALRVILVLGFIGACGVLSPYYLAFPAGAFLAALMAGRKIEVPLWVAILTLAVAAFFAGYTDGRGDYAIVKSMLPLPALPKLLHIGAGMIAITAVLCSSQLRRLLSGGWARFLGEMSFPIYLIHIPVLSSAGCAAFLIAGAAGYDELAGLAGAITTFFGTFLVGLLIRDFDQVWIRIVSACAGRGRALWRSAPEQFLRREPA